MLINLLILYFDLFFPLQIDFKLWNADQTFLNGLAQPDGDVKVLKDPDGIRSQYIKYECFLTLIVFLIAFIVIALKEKLENNFLY